MPPRRKKKESDKKTPKLSDSRPRFYWDYVPGVGERAERSVSRAQGAVNQARADFYGVGDTLPSGSNMHSMQALLAELIDDLHLEEEEFAAEILARAWAKAVGPFISGRAELTSVSHGTACIRTAHPTVRFELNRLKPQIIRALNAELGDNTVTSVRISHG